MANIREREARLVELHNQLPNLSRDELKEFNRLLRLEKNRKAAHQSRQKKKKQVENLIRENKQLKEQVEFLNMRYTEFQNFIIRKASHLAEEFLNQHQHLQPYYYPTVYIPQPPPPPIIPIPVEPQLAPPPINLPQRPFMAPPPVGLPTEDEDEEMLELVPPLNLPTEEED